MYSRKIPKRLPISWNTSIFSLFSQKLTIIHEKSTKKKPKHYAFVRELTIDIIIALLYI